jgi:hypothetical protein
MFKAKSIIFAFLILAIFTALFLSAYNSEAALVGNTNQATLSVSPQTGSYNANDNFAVSIYLNTNGENVVVVAAYLNYDKVHFEVISIDTTNSVFSVEAEKIIDSTNGVIKITRGNPTSSHVNSSNALVVVINFKAVSGVNPSTDNLGFQFAAGSTLESNVIKDDGLGTDILSGIYNGKYTITGGTVDTQVPIVTAFSIPLTSTSPTVPISSFTATDNIAVISYIITESSAAPSTSASGWSSSVPISYTFSSAGPKTLYAWAKDAAGNISVSKSATVSILTSDTQAPTISSVSANSITSNSATIVWTTNESSDSQIEYGPTASYGSQTSLDISMVTSHSVLLNSLSPSTVYHYRVKSKDAVGNSATGPDNTFTTTTTSLTLSVSLTANQNSGVAPFNEVDLTANVSGSAIGNINYTFYCNRSDAGINITSPYQAKHDNQSQTNYLASDICSYGLSGIYTAKVIVERGSYQAEARTIIMVNVPYQNSFPIGNVDGADFNHVTGWAYDVDAKSTPISVHVYVDGVINGSAVANLSRSDIVGAVGGVIKEAGHGFDYKFSNLSVGTHTINVYAINTPEGTNPELPGSPKVVTISVVTTPTPLPVPTPSPTPQLTPSPTHSLIKSSTDTKVYEIINNLKHWILNPQIFSSYGFTWNNIQIVNSADLNNYPRVKLLKAQGDVKVYYLTETGQIRHIPSPEIFNSYNNNWEEVITVSQIEIESYQTSDLIKLENGTKVYKLENIIKRWIKTAEAFNRLKYDWNKIAPVNQTELDYYAEGAEIK